MTDEVLRELGLMATKYPPYRGFEAWSDSSGTYFSKPDGLVEGHCFQRLSEEEVKRWIDGFLR